MQATLTAKAGISRRIGTTKRLEKKTALTICIVITAIVMAVEIFYSLVSGSLMLMSDAIHMFSHAASLGISLLALIIAARKTDNTYPFGLRRVEVLAAFVNGISLLFFVGIIAWKAWFRMMDPQEILTMPALKVAIAGLAVNLLTAVVLSQAGLEDLNTRSAFAHMLADTFSSIAIIIGTVIIGYTGWYVIDGILSLVVAGVITWWACGLLCESSLVLLNRKPDHMDPDMISKDLYGRFDTIIRVKDVKIWEISGDEIAASVKVQVYPGQTYEYKRLRREIEERLMMKHKISRSFIELDW